MNRKARKDMKLINDEENLGTGVDVVDSYHEPLKPLPRLLMKMVKIKIKQIKKNGSNN